MFSFGTSGSRGKTALGIDIGPHTIKVAQLAEHDSGTVVTHAARILTPPNAIHAGVITDPIVMGKIIRNALRADHISATDASLSVPNEYATVRWIDLPAMDDEAVQAAAPFEARKYLNYAVDQADLKIVPMEVKPEDTSTTMRALLVATPQAISHSRAHSAEAAGLRVNCIEVEAFSLMRALYTPQMKRDMVWSSQSRAYLQIGNDSSSMYVLQNAAIRFVRGLSWGSGRLSAALKEGIGCTIEHAGYILANGFASISPQGTLFWVDDNEVCETDALAPELERLCKEIQRLVNYYLSLFPERSFEGMLNHITLSGGAAGVKGLKEYLAGHLEIEFNLGDPFVAKQIHIAPKVAGAIEGYRAGYTIAIGLALGELQSSKKSLRSEPNTEYIWRRQAA